LQVGENAVLQSGQGGLAQQGSGIHQTQEYKS
jgi:hypothetical protein